MIGKSPKLSKINSLGSGVPRLVLGDWGCYTDRMRGLNIDVANGDLRRGNRAYMPPEILSAARGKLLDYRRSGVYHVLQFVLTKTLLGPIHGQ